ncbi:hypothetical protein NEOLI_004968, partial [Neolecta irregularis DAH-3]
MPLNTARKAKRQDLICLRSCSRRRGLSEQRTTGKSTRTRETNTVKRTAKSTTETKGTATKAAERMRGNATTTRFRRRTRGSRGLSSIWRACLARRGWSTGCRGRLVSKMGQVETALERHTAYLKGVCGRVWDVRVGVLLVELQASVPRVGGEVAGAL